MTPTPVAFLRTSVCDSDASLTLSAFLFFLCVPFVLPHRLKSTLETQFILPQIFLFIYFLIQREFKIEIESLIELLFGILQLLFFFFLFFLISVSFVTDYFLSVYNPPSHIF